MKKYSIFYEENGKKYNVYTFNKKFYLGGTRCEWLLFNNKLEAEKVAREIRKQKTPFSFEEGIVKVKRAILVSN